MTPECADNRYMRYALREAIAAYREGEVPVGAVIVRDGVVVSRAHNRREGSKSPTAHAEVLAISRAARRTGRWNLHGCVMYVTLEPCLMCIGAIVMSNIKDVRFGAYDLKRGCFSSPYSCRVPDTVRITGGIMAGRSSRMLKGFFKKLR